MLRPLPIRSRCGVGAPSAGASHGGREPDQRAGGEPSTITVTAKDAGGNPVSGVTVALQAGGSGNTLTQPASPTDANGQTTGTFSSTSLGGHTITATLNGSTTVSDNAIVTVTAGPPASAVNRSITRARRARGSQAHRRHR